jgi:hypothetical protein
METENNIKCMYREGRLSQISHLLHTKGQFLSKHVLEVNSSMAGMCTYTGPMLLGQLLSLENTIVRQDNHDNYPEIIGALGLAPANFPGTIAP